MGAPRPLFILGTLPTSKPFRCRPRCLCSLLGRGGLADRPRLFARSRLESTPAQGFSSTTDRPGWIPYAGVVIRPSPPKSDRHFKTVRRSKLLKKVLDMELDSALGHGQTVGHLRVRQTFKDKQLMNLLLFRSELRDTLIQPRHPPGVAQIVASGRACAGSEPPPIEQAW